MYKKTITYKDFDDVERTEDFFFNLNEAEILELNMKTEGGLEKFLMKIISEKDQKKIVDYFKDLVLMSYGEKSLDGKHFVKSEEISKAFSYTQAYSDFFIELATNEQAASEFVNGIIPKEKINNLESKVVPINK